MLEWTFENNINKLKGARAICWNKYDTHMCIVVFSKPKTLYFCKLNNSESTKPFLVFCQGKLFPFELHDKVEVAFNKLCGGFQCRPMVGTIGQMNKFFFLCSWGEMNG
jgi:hypothetical protein